MKKQRRNWRDREYDRIVFTAMSAKGLNILDTIYFHTQNPNGVNTIQRKLDAEINALVDANRCAEEAVRRYGSGDSKLSSQFWSWRDPDMVGKIPFPNRRQLEEAIKAYKVRNARAAEFIAEIKGEMPPDHIPQAQAQALYRVAEIVRDLVAMETPDKTIIERLRQALSDAEINQQDRRAA